MLIMLQKTFDILCFYSGCHSPEKSPSKAHLSTSIVPQTPHKALVFHGLTVPGQAVTPVPGAVHLRQTKLPWWVAIQFEERTEHYKEIWLRLEDVCSVVSIRQEWPGGDLANLSVHKFRRDILWR